MDPFSQIIALLDKATHYYIICTNMEGNYSYINQNYANRFRHVNEDFTGKPFHITMHPDDIPACMDAGYKSLENKDALVPVALRKHDGKGGYVVTQWEFKGIFDEDGTPTGVFCLGYDITEFISRLKDKDMLLDDIAFNQSHIIRRPVANILGAVDLLKQYNIPAEATEILDIVFENTRDLDTIIRKMADDIYPEQA
jgi:hypothetical protein